MTKPGNQPQILSRKYELQRMVKRHEMDLLWIELTGKMPDETPEHTGVGQPDKDDVI